MYRAGIEWLLGFRVRAGTLVVDPCIPKGWPGFSIDFRHEGTRYHIAVENPRGVNRGVTRLELDGVPVAGGSIPLADDGGVHRVHVVLG
jgi:cyclic beta-1,2-glucan synthetase